MEEKKSVNPATLEMIEVARAKGISTAFSRAEVTKPCPIGREGNCCFHCFMGPCRLVGKTTEGICGATRETVQARGFLRHVAAGASAHSDHGRDMVLTLIAVAKGETKDYQVKDERKLHKVARLMGIPTQGKTKEQVALEVGVKALQQFGQQEGELVYLSRAPQKRQALWRRLGIAPRGIDREIVEAMHRTTMGTDQDAEHLLLHSMRVSLADGWGGSMLATDVGDILFGTPAPKLAKSNLGVLKEDQVNIVVHGHHPVLPEVMLVAAREPESLEYARSKGAKGINLAGVCCTGNEMLMRHGIPVAGDFLHQELAIATGAVEAMVVDVQCVFQSLVNVAKPFHTKVITTSEKAKITGATHIQLDEHRALEVARLIVRTAIDNFPNRKEVHIPNEESELVVGFSHEYLNYMLGGLYRESFRPLNDAVMQGRIRGAAAVVGCNNPRSIHEGGISKVVRELISQDVLVVVTGCGGTGSAQYGYLLPEMMNIAGPGLREICETVGIPPVVHMGSCVDNSRILTTLSQMATEGGLGEDISDLPAVGLCPEWMSEKALTIATYAVASGCYVIFGVGSPVEGSPEVTEMMLSGWEGKVGGKLEFEPDLDKMVAKTLAHIDKKRKALNLEEYSPARYAKSQNYLPGDYTSPEVFKEGRYTLAGL